MHGDCIIFCLFEEKCLKIYARAVRARIAFTRAMQINLSACADSTSLSLSLHVFIFSSFFLHFVCVILTLLFFLFLVDTAAE